MGLKLDWLKDDQRLMLERGYLEKGETPEQRYQTICDTIEKISYSRLLKLDYANLHGYNILGIRERFEEYFSKGWVSLATPVIKSFGAPSNLPISCNHSVVEDSLDDIYKGLHEIGMLAKHGAGTAVNFSDIRPVGSEISTGGYSNTIMDWIELYADLMSKTAQNCYKEDVEILTEHGWKLFSNLSNEDKVASVLDDDSIEFVLPLEYFEYNFNGDLLRFRDSKNIDISVTDNHNMVFKRRKRVSGKKINGKYIDNTKKISSDYILKEAEHTPVHRDILMFKSSSKKGGRELTFKERLLIAYQADGSISSKNCMRFHFSNPNKIERLRHILNNLPYKYSESTIKGGTTKFHVNFQEEPHKSFSWVELDKIGSNWGKSFIEELSNWDSEIKNTSYNSFNYSCVNEYNIDIVQAVCSISGYASTKYESTPEKNIQKLFHLYISEKRHFGLERLTPKKESYKGKVYCVEVPSNKILVRSNGRTLVCGNSQRRGFLTVYLSLDHPEIMDFLNIGTKAIPKEKRRFFETLTTGVIIPEGWRDKLKKGDSEKRKIFQKVLNTRKEAGYPYILDEENANKGLCQAYYDKGLRVRGSNICIEAMEYCDYEKTFACCLSAVNLYYYDEWKSHPFFIKDMNIMLDCVIEEYIEKGKKLPGLQKAIKFAEEHRAIGLGVTAFHSYLQKNMIVFGSLESYQKNYEIFSYLRKESDLASEWMAKNWGEPKILKEYGHRNTSRMAIAPKKSTTAVDGGSYLALSEGIEPHKFNYGEKKAAKIQFEFKNKELKELLIQKGKNTDEVWESMLDHNGSVQHLDFLSDHEKDVFKTFSEISQMDVIKLAGQRQQFIDMGQSINILIHPDTPAKDIIKLHLAAFDEGLKSLYYQNGINASQKFSQDLLTCSSCEG